MDGVVVVAVGVAVGVVIVVVGVVIVAVGEAGSVYHCQVVH